MINYLEELLNKPLSSLTIIGNLILIEGILSIDNAALLATMILKLDKKDQKKAFKYGIMGAYLFRGICLFFASFLMNISWLKPLGGAYLLFLGISHFIKKKPDIKEKKTTLKKTFFISPFWTTIISIELIDLSFSIDNVLAAVAFSENLLLIYLGVFLGILSMRILARYFMKLMKKYPFLEKSAFSIIILLGIKLIFSFFESNHSSLYFLTKHKKEIDALFSCSTIMIFVVPILVKTFFLKTTKN